MLLHEFDPNKDAVINPEMLVNKIEDFPGCNGVLLF